MQKFDSVFLAAVLIVHYCSHLPSRRRRSRWGFPTRIYFKLLSFSSGIIEFWHSFSVGIRFIAVTSTQKAITQVIPVFRANCFAVLNSRIIFSEPRVPTFQYFCHSRVWKPKTSRPLASCLCFVLCFCSGLKSRYFLLTCPPFCFVVHSRLPCQSI